MDQPKKKYTSPRVDLFTIQPSQMVVTSGKVTLGGLGHGQSMFCPVEGVEDEEPYNNKGIWQ